MPGPGMDEIKAGVELGTVLTVATYEFAKDAKNAVAKSFHRFQDKDELELIEHIDDIREERCTNIFNPVTQKNMSFEEIFQLAPKGDKKAERDEKKNSESKEISIPKQAVALSNEILDAIKKLIKPLDPELNGYYEHLLYAANAITAFDNFRMAYGEKKSHQKILDKFKNIFKKAPSRSDPISATNQWLVIAMQLHCDPAQGIEFTIELLTHIHDFIMGYSELHGGDGSTLYNFMMRAQNHLTTARKILEDYTKKKELAVTLPPFVAACRAESDNLLKICMKLIPTQAVGKTLFNKHNIEVLPTHESSDLIDGAELPDIAAGVIRPQLAEDSLDHGHLNKIIRLPKDILPFFCDWIQANAQDQLDMIHFLTKNKNTELPLTPLKFSFALATDSKTKKKFFKALRENYFDKEATLLTRKVINPGAESNIKHLTTLTDDEIETNILRVKEICELNYYINLVQYFSRKLFEASKKLRSVYNDESESLIADIIFKTVEEVKNIFTEQHKKAVEAYEGLEEAISDGPIGKEQKILLAKLRVSLIGTGNVKSVVCGNLDKMINHHRDMQKLHSERSKRTIKPLVNQSLDPTASEILMQCEKIATVFKLDSLRHFKHSNDSSNNAPLDEKSLPYTPIGTPRADLVTPLNPTPPPTTVVVENKKPPSSMEDNLDLIQGYVLLKESNPAYQNLYIALRKMKKDAQNLINDEHQNPERRNKGLRMEQITKDLCEATLDFLELSPEARKSNTEVYCDRMRLIFPEKNKIDPLIDRHKHEILKIVKDIVMSLIHFFTYKNKVGGELFKTTSRENINRFTQQWNLVMEDITPTNSLFAPR